MTPTMTALEHDPVSASAFGHAHRAVAASVRSRSSATGSVDAPARMVVRDRKDLAAKGHVALVAYVPGTQPGVRHSVETQQIEQPPGRGTRNRDPRPFCFSESSREQDMTRTTQHDQHHTNRDQ